MFLIDFVKFMSWSPFYGRHFKKSLPEKHDVRIILTGTKLSLQFNIKDDFV